MEQEGKPSERDEHDCELDRGSRVHNIQMEVKRDNVAIEQVIFDDGKAVKWHK